MASFELHKICLESGNIPAIISKHGSITYGQLAKYISGTGRNIARSGIMPGDTIAILSENSPEMVILLLALMQYGAIPVPLNIRLPETEIQRLLSKLKCRHLLVQENFRELHFQPGSKRTSISSLIDGDPSEGKHHSEPIPLDRRCDILFTSGSGGEAKAVAHRMGNHYFSALGSNTNIELVPGDKWMASLPLFHVGGLAIIFRCILAGATMVIPDKDLTAVQNIERYQITHLSMVATQFNRLINSRISSIDIHRLKAVLLGGGPISRKPIAEAFKSEIPVFVSYGSTEMSSQVTTSCKNDRLDQLYTAGKVLPYREVKISADTEVFVRGKTLFDGYVQEGNLDLELHDGWFATGDLGTVDPDGYLTLLGRKDNMFISGGENIHPEEIERVLMEIPEIETAMVVDVPDHEYGARPFAFIQSTKKLQEEYVRSILAERISRYKIPAYFIFSDFSTGGFKAGRSRLRKKALAWIKNQSLEDK